MLKTRVLAEFDAKLHRDLRGWEGGGGLITSVWTPSSKTPKHNYAIMFYHKIIYCHSL